MKAKDIMTVAVVTANEDTPIQSIVASMLKHRISALPVVDDQERVIGMVSEGDLMNRPEAQTYRARSWWLSLIDDPASEARDFLKTYGNKAADVMTRTVVTAEEDEPVSSVAEKLERHRIKRVPVVRNGRLVGIISRANLLHCVGHLQGGVAPAGDSEAERKSIFARLAEAGIVSGAINVIVLPDSVELWGLVDSPEELAAAEVAVSSVSPTRKIKNYLNILTPKMRASI